MLIVKSYMVIFIKNINDRAVEYIVKGERQ